MKASWLRAIVCCLALIVIAGSNVPVIRAAAEPERLKQFIYVVRLVPRLYEEKAWTKQDREAAMRHFERLKSAGEHGPVIFAGRTNEEADKTFGIVVFEAPDAADAKKFMENDPAVKAGIMTADLHPYIAAVQRGP